MFDFDVLEEQFEHRDEARKAEKLKEEVKSLPAKAVPETTRGYDPPRFAPIQRKIRVLALHGGGSNANIIKYQVMPLRRALGDQAEWEFLNGGRSWKFNEGQKPPEIMQALAAGMPFYGWYAVEHTDQSDRPYQEKLFDPSVEFTYSQVDVGIDRVLHQIKENGPVDILVGFSQGCIVSHLVAAILRQRGEEIPWRLSVLFNGMRVRDRSFERLFETPLDLPCVMVFGRQDEFYHYGKTSQIALYKDPVVLEHEEGHKFPSAAPRAKEIYDEVVARIYESCGIAQKKFKEIKI